VASTPVRNRNTLNRNDNFQKPWSTEVSIMKKTEKVKNSGARNTSATKDTQNKNELAHTVRNLKRVVAGLSIALVACVAYILAAPTQSTPPPNMMNSSQPTSEPFAAPDPMQSDVEIVSEDPADSPRRDMPPDATPDMNPAVTGSPPASSPTGGQTVTLNPPHGQPGHRCDIPVGNPLP